jgi:hypothetical protein
LDETATSTEINLKRDRNPEQGDTEQDGNGNRIPEQMGNCESTRIKKGTLTYIDDGDECAGQQRLLGPHAIYH